MDEPTNWQKIIALDNERRQIEERIHIRAKLHHGVAVTPDERVKLTGHNVRDDATRYIQIEDLQWSLMGDTTQPPDTHVSVPD